MEDTTTMISDISSMLRTKEYKDFIDTLTQKEKQLRETVFANYFKENFNVENQIYNEKNATVEMMKAIIEIKDMAQNISAGKYLVEYCDKALDMGTKQIKEAMGGINSGLTMGVYTESDLMIKVSDTYKYAIWFYEDKIESLKNTEKSDSTLDDPKEE